MQKSEYKKGNNDLSKNKISMETRKEPVQYLDFIVINMY